MELVLLNIFFLSCPYVPFLSRLHKRVFRCVTFVPVRNEFYGKLDELLNVCSLVMPLIERGIAVTFLK